MQLELLHILLKREKPNNIETKSPSEYQWDVKVFEEKKSYKKTEDT